MTRKIIDYEIPIRLNRFFEDRWAGVRMEMGSLPVDIFKRSIRFLLREVNRSMREEIRGKAMTNMYTLRRILILDCFGEVGAIVICINKISSPARREQRRI